MKRPYITLKFAQTLDGKIAARDGSSQWISAPPALKFTHGLRARNRAILIGVGTVLRDNPSLTTRLVKGKSPARIIIDPRLRTPLGSRVTEDTRKAKTIIITTRKAPKAKMEKLKASGVELVVLKNSKNNSVNLRNIIRILYKKGIKSILVEGGKKTITSFIKAGIVDKLIAVISPKILGRGIEPVGDLGIRNIKGALKLQLVGIKKIGKDIIYAAAIK